MNLLDFFRNERQRQLAAAQEARRFWATQAVHRAPGRPPHDAPPGLWTAPPHAAKSLLAVVNIPRWPLPRNEPAAVRFLDLPKLHQGNAQWLRSKVSLGCPLTTVQPRTPAWSPCPSRRT